MAQKKEEGGSKKLLKIPVRIDYFQRGFVFFLKIALSPSGTTGRRLLHILSVHGRV